MRVRVLAAGVLVALVVCAASAGKKEPTLNDKVVEYCTKQKGKMVGDGECGSLAEEALKAAGAKPRSPKDDPNEGDFVWGKLVLTVEIKGNKPDLTGKLADVLPGDVVQFRDTKWVTRSGNVISMTTADHHTAVVKSVDKGRAVIRTLHQNHNGKKVVQDGTLPLSDMKAGWIRVYRPLPPDEK